MGAYYEPVKRRYQLIQYNQLISPHENGNPGFNRGITGINRTKVNKIKREYDPAQVRPVLVSFRDGKYYIIDGQHTALAIYELNGEDGTTLINCDVREGLTYQQEAQLFYDFNTNSRLPGAADKIWALVCAGDADAIEFKNLIERCGYTFGRKSANTISPINTCWKIFNGRAGVKRLENILNLIHDTWPNDASAVNITIVDGLNLFFKYNEYEYSPERFVKTFSNVSYKSIISDAKALYKSMSDRAYTMPVCTYLMIGKKYNSNLRTNRIKLVLPS